MAWTAPRTWLVGEVVTAAEMNANVRDNLATIGGAIGAYAPAAANTDLAAPSNWHHTIAPTSTAFSVRSIGAAAQPGQRLLLRNISANPITLLHQVAGGTGAQLFMRSLGSLVLTQYDAAEFIYDGTNWAEVDRNQAGYSLIFDVVVGRGQPGDPTAPAATIDSNTILGGVLPTTFKHLKLLLQGRANDAVTFETIAMLLNNDSGALYDWQRVFGQGTTTATASETFADTSASIGYMAGASAAAGSAADFEVTFQNYNGTDFHKLWHSQFGTTGQATTVGLVGSVIGKYRSLTAMTRLSVKAATGSLVAGTRATLYGMN